MTHAFITGFFLGISLIIAIGAQNAFVLRQGILRQHIFYVALFCSISDTVLIFLGVLGISFLLDDFINLHSKLIFGLASLWLLSYGLLRLRSLFQENSIIIGKNIESPSLPKTISIIAILTFTNPHVYLDTMILIGSISQQFISVNRIYFAIGACFASFIWFFGIAYSAKALTPIMNKAVHWKILDTLIALIMFAIAISLAGEAGLF